MTNQNLDKAKHNLNYWLDRQLQAMSYPPRQSDPGSEEIQDALTAYIRELCKLIAQDEA
jgi:hypothetical protein